MKTIGTDLIFCFNISSLERLHGQCRPRNLVNTIGTISHGLT